jgi:hypothetical protein
VRAALDEIRTLYQPSGLPSDTPIAGTEDALQITASFARIAPRADEFYAGYTIGCSPSTRSCARCSRPT